MAPQQLRTASTASSTVGPYNMDLSGFPDCPSGDVQIVLAPHRQFKLHSAILRCNSTFFNENLTFENATALSNEAKREGVCIRWRFDLTDCPKETEAGPGALTMTVS
jgi:hypothetical protein